jgi:hypothetical protein
MTCAKIAETAQECMRVPGHLWEDVHEANCNDYSGDDEDYFCICPERKQ